MFVLFCTLVIPYMLFVLYVNDLLHFLLSFWQNFDLWNVYVFVCMYVYVHTYERTHACKSCVYYSMKPGRI
jgi:hypothetical protein